MNLYVMRHGTTIWNEKGITQGRTNNRLSKSGIELTQKVALEYKDVQFDIIICSPLMRTIQTANIINQYHKVKIIKDQNIIEIDQGIFTGKSKDEITEEQRIQKKLRSKQTKMETYEQCFKRTKHFVQTLKTNYNYENILIVTHNCTATFIEDIILNKKIDFENDVFLRNFKNAEIKKFII